MNRKMNRKMPKPIPHEVAVLIVAAACAVLFLRGAGVKASESESVTWGATDPTWSPDGSKLAFSLFGSIWQVSGSKAGRPSRSAPRTGYHAHPAWSPKGDKIAFMRGTPPGNSNRRHASPAT